VDVTWEEIVEELKATIGELTVRNAALTVANKKLTAQVNEPASTEE
jgi:regulator of replication initiation timing